jgi:hypothetical protein
VNCVRFVGEVELVVLVDGNGRIGRMLIGDVCQEQKWKWTVGQD